MGSGRQVIPIFLLVAVVVAILITKEGPEQVQQVPALTVRTAKLSAELPIRRIQISGTTQSAETTVLRFQVGGRVIEKSIRLGGSIDKGDAVAKLYSPELEPITVVAKENLARLSAQAEQAQRDFDRVDALYKDRAVTLAEWEKVRTNLTANQNARSAAESELSRATQVAGELSLLAPFPGSVTEVMIDIGDVVAAGSPAIRLSNPNLVELKLAVSDRIVEQIKLGQSVSVNRALDVTQIPLQGVVSEISPYRERGSLPEIIISLDAAQIGPGVAVNANIEIQAKQGMSIPTRSVLMTGENTVAVYRVVDGIANLVPIRPIRLDTDSVLIEQGLAPGDALVVEGISQLYSGAKVVEAADEAELSDQAQSDIEADTTINVPESER